MDYVVPGHVPPIDQRKTNLCWAAVLTMMVSWKDSTIYTMENVMDRAGSIYRTKFDRNELIHPNDIPELLKSFSIVSEPPAQNYAVAGWIQLLRDYGPLWVTLAPDALHPWLLHAVVISGIRSDDTIEGTKFSLIDSGDPDQLEKNVSLADFVEMFERVAESEEIVFQVFHYPS